MNVISQENNVIYVDELPLNAPISGYLETKEIVINVNEWPKYTKDEQLAMFYHEQAHFINQSVDEFEADLIGFIIFIESGNKNLDATISWMNKLFNENNPEQMERLRRQKKRLDQYKLTGVTIVSSAGSTNDLMGGGYFEENTKVGAAGAAAAAQGIAPYAPGIIDSAGGLANNVLGGLSGLYNTAFNGFNNLFFGRKNNAARLESQRIDAMQNITEINTRAVTNNIKALQRVGIANAIAYAVMGAAAIGLLIYVLKPRK
jgi:hypothetical protein